MLCCLLRELCRCVGIRGCEAGAPEGPCPCRELSHPVLGTQYEMLQSSLAGLGCDIHPWGYILNAQQLFVCPFPVCSLEGGFGSFQAALHGSSSSVLKH